MGRAETDPAVPSQRLRGIQLPPIQTSFPTRPHQQSRRQRVEELATVNQSSQSAPPIENAVLGRKTSRGLIPNLFGRNKSYRTARPEPTVTGSHEGKNAEATGQQPKENERKASEADRTPFIQDINIVQSIPRTSTSPVQKRPPRGGRGRSFRKESTTWDPPPLFQAYPQAIKHATLPAPVLSADTILRHVRLGEDYVAHPPPIVPDQNSDDVDPEAHKKKGRSLKKRKAAGHNPVADSEWTEKVYVLVTSGFFLQYAGEGKFDRLPEKILPLGKDSAAFASDAIPGKRWVLQVAQEISENDGSFSTQGPSSVFKKLGFFQEARRTASNLLLVIDCPEEMNSWLVAVRKEIESLGGKKYLPDALASKDHSEAERKLQQKPSQRYLVTRDRQYSEEARKPLPHGESMAIVPKPIRKDSYTTEPTEPRRSFEAPSVSNTTVSGDQKVLEKLRETPRMSYVSAGTKTMSASPGSSPGSSPVKATFCLVDSGNPHNGMLTEVTVTPKAYRESTRALSATSLADRKSQENDAVQLGSLSRSVSSDGQSSSPPPNFSVPSFSKRYSLANNLSQAKSPPATRASTVLPPIVVEENSATGAIAPASNDSSISRRTSPKGSKSLANLSVHYNPPPPLAFEFEPKNSPAELILSPKSDSGVPRRFSSLEYSRGISPVPAQHPFSKPPHPPPTAALPEIPGMGPKALSSGSSRHSMQSMISPTQERNAHRPISMQLRSPPIVRVNQSSFQIVSKHSERINESTISSASSTMPEFPNRNPSGASMPQPARSAPLPSVQSEVQPRRKPSPPAQVTVQAQTSLPFSHKTPPPSMPPLPRLPSIRVSRRGFRGSFEGPWSPGYGAERKESQGIRAN